MSDNELIVERHGPLAVMTIDRPKVHNALNAATLRRLAQAFEGFATAGGIGAIVITGAGARAFSAGADLDELTGLDAEQAHATLAAGQRTMRIIEHSSVPVIAAVNGLALGGGFELVLAADLPVLSTAAELALPESGLGLIPGYGGTQRLARFVGAPVAAYLMLTGERLPADRAYELGLAPLPPVQPDDLLPTAMQLGRDIAARGPRAQQAILRLLRSGAPSDQDLALETATAAIATGSPEAAEGIGAFRERRAPVFLAGPAREGHQEGRSGE